MSVVGSLGAADRHVHLDRRRRGHRWSAGIPFAVLAVVARVLIVRLPLTPDEGGYLLAASQWHLGTSTYGAYFVDRPPLLMAIYAGADLLGGGLALRVIGVVAAAVAVLIAGRIGGRAAAAAAAVFVITPLFGTGNVDGELLALPLVLGGLLMLVRALTPAEPHLGRVAAAAGVLAMAAVLVKQDMVDVFVGAVGASAALAVDRRWQHLRELLIGFAVGALSTGVSALGLAWLRGTSPTRLWDALVTFRVQAGAVISANGDAAGGTTERLHVMLRALVLSGAPLVAVVALVAAGMPPMGPSRGRAPELDLRWVAVPVLTWEAVGALLGGSYWLHYLIALIPGIVLLVAAVPLHASTWKRRLLAGALVIAGISTSDLFAQGVAHQPAPSSDAQVSAYLAAHRRSGTTVVVAFGHPNIVYDAGMTSPYEHLWSLSVRVRDPRLSELMTVMGEPQAPQWVVVAGASLDTWGVDATAAEQVLRQHYRLATTVEDWRVFERN
ncbi:hypothetical protein [Nocardioides sp. Iso805N]|uniref:hypothetical protein n=1 Tax=Nocardioides sp. Iso805N TaxID=1283287 RepID=UPI0012F8943A|nr:hypothetical protein [Nocardioides sp. Iso805N]